MNVPKITNQGVAVFCIASAVLTVFAAFWLSRGDHDLKLMSLQSVLTTAGTLLGIAGTLLVGVAAYRQITGASDLPPGSHAEVTESSTVSVSPTPVNPTPPVDPAQPK
jgi:hypothetical protein